MFGVIYVKHKSLILYKHLSHAISSFSEFNGFDDVKVVPNLNNSFELLSSEISDLESFHIPIKTIINIGIRRREDFSCKLNSALLILEQDEIDEIKKHYHIDYIKYSKRECKLCNLTFKINKDCSSRGYAPIYHIVLTKENLEDYHVFGSQIKLDKELEKLKEDDYYFLNLKGSLQGLYLSKFPLPETLKNGDFICWNCMKYDDYICIWSH